MLPLLEEFSLPTFQTYASEHGYQVVVESLQADGPESAFSARFSKLQLLYDQVKRLLSIDHSGRAILLWLDADAMVCEYATDIAGDLMSRDFMGLVLEHRPALPRLVPNTGVWLLRACPQALDFLADAIQAGPQPGPLADAGSVIKLLGWHRGNEHYIGAKPGWGSHWLQYVTWLSVEWNTLYVNPEIFWEYAGMPTADDPRIVHFAGMTPDQRRPAMAALAASLARA
jgi:hypothetical protein